MAAYFGQALTFLIRPLGGVLFAHIGDRVGRKKTLVMTLTIMGLGTVAIGLLPTYTQIGMAAPVLLYLFRIIQGLAIGGEWGVFSIVLVVALGLWIRSGLDETPAFRALRETGQVEKTPLATTLRKHWRAVLLAVGAKAAETAPSTSW